MAHPVITQLQKNPNATLILVLATLIFSFAANLYGLLYGVSIVIPHLFYIPIILAAFFFPRRGVAFTVALSAAYFLMVVLIRPGNSADIISAVGRCIVFIIIAAVVSYLSERVNSREAALRQAKDEWERTFNAVPDLIALIDREHRILRVNKAMANSLGMTPEYLIGRRCYEIVHRASSPPVQCPHEMLLADGREHASEVHEDVLGGDFIVTASPLYGEDGTLIGSVHSARDVTARKKVEDALRQKTDELDRFFSVNLDLLCIADTDGYFRRLNIAWERTLGYTREELMAKKFIDFVHPQDLEKTLNAVARLADRKEVIDFVNRYRCKDGTYRWIEWRSYPFGNLIYAAARDITDRITAEDAILSANNKLNILSSVTRHDILNQITALFAYLDLSRDLASQNPQMLDYIGKEVEIIHAIQRQIEFTRFYQDIGVKAPEWQEVVPIIGAAAAQLPMESVLLRADLGNLALYADPLLEKVFYNLMENAIRHGGHVSTITFSAREADDGLLLTYQDNGVGVEPQNKEKIFERGFGKHTGLGLFLIREILSITGIRIAETGEYGGGARFEIRVPKGAYRFIENSPENRMGT